jgi:DNA (cytosine-5)-methyltransferase 1
MTAYYNEIDSKAAAWLRELIKAGLIADGEVDERSIADVRPDDLRGFTQCHFFAGIGGWSYALRLAGWPDERAVWTGSCPCQPWSVAGVGEGADDPRHLWPAWFRLIAECRPPAIFGEQVASKDGLLWLDLVYVDLEAEGYAVGAVDCCAASLGANHIRPRLWLVADTDGHGRQGLADWRCSPASAVEQAWCAARGASTAPHPAYAKRREWTLSGATGRMGREDGISWNGHWENAPEPFIRRGVDGFSARVGRLRGYGNAIVPQVAAAFIDAYLAARNDA